jgi:hypothetical protein
MHSKPINTSQGPLLVKPCGCGGIHLCIGGLSLNLSKEVASFLHQRLGEIVTPEKPTEPPNNLLHLVK